MAAEKKSRRSDSSKGGQEFLCENLNFAGKEAFKRLRTNLQFCFADSESCGVVGITSSHPAEGKSLTAINLAYSLAQLNKRVLLIDADMRRASIDEKLNMDPVPGLSNLLTDTNSAAGSLREYQPADESIGFQVLLSGDVPPNPSELLNSPRMGRLLDMLRTKYDYIVIDLPPVGAGSDAQTISKLVDGMLIVIRENHTSSYILNECITQLNLTNSKIFGFVINGSLAGASKTSSYGKYGSYSSNYSYSNYYNK